MSDATARPEPPAAVAGAGAAIYDLGYQHYHGERRGRRGAVLAVYAQGLRAVFGIGRGGRAKVAPILLVVFVAVPAVIQAALTGIGGGMMQVFTHQGYFRTTLWLFALFCAFQTPELVTSDLQHRVLPLYFSRALRRSDYVLARWGALATGILLVSLLPHVILLLGSVFAATDFGSAWRYTWPLLPRILAAAVTIAVLLSAVSLAIAALMQRRTLATATIFAAFLLSTAFVTPIVIQEPPLGWTMVLSPPLVGDGVTHWIFSTSETSNQSANTLVGAMNGAPVTATGSTNRPISKSRRTRQQRQAVGVVEAAHLPGVVYLAATLGYLVIAAGLLTLRYRNIAT